MSPLTKDMIRSRFYVPSTEKVLLKTVLLHEAQKKLAMHTSNLFNQLGVRIKNRLETYLEHDTETDVGSCD